METPCCLCRWSGLQNTKESSNFLQSFYGIEGWEWRWSSGGASWGTLSPGHMSYSVSAAITEWMAYEQQKLVSHSSGGQEVQDPGACRLSTWWKPSFWMYTAIFSPYPHMAEGAREFSGVSFMRALIPFIRASSSRSNRLPKAPPPNTAALGVQI